MSGGRTSVLLPVGLSIKIRAEGFILRIVSVNSSRSVVPGSCKVVTLNPSGFTEWVTRGFGAVSEELGECGCVLA